MTTSRARARTGAASASGPCINQRAGYGWTRPTIAAHADVISGSSSGAIDHPFRGVDFAGRHVCRKGWLWEINTIELHDGFTDQSASLLSHACSGSPGATQRQPTSVFMHRASASGGSRGDEGRSSGSQPRRVLQPKCCKCYWYKYWYSTHGVNVGGDGSRCL